MSNLLWWAVYVAKYAYFLFCNYSAEFLFSNWAKIQNASFVQMSQILLAIVYNSPKLKRKIQEKIRLNSYLIFYFPHNHMRHQFFALICVLILSCPILLAQESPPAETVEAEHQTRDINEILNDREFVRLYEQMTGQRLSPGTQAGVGTPFVPDSVSEQSPWSIDTFQSPPVSASSQGQSVLWASDSVQSLIATQQLKQLEYTKSLILNDLQNVKTCGYRGIKFVSLTSETNLESQTDFQSRQYTASPDNLHWAIHGNGFFVLRKVPKPSDETATGNHFAISALYYTRAGQFELTQERKLAMKRGGETYLLQPETEIPEQIDATINFVQLAHFQFPERLQRIDGVIFAVAPGGETPVLSTPNEASGGTIRTQQYEAANVDFAKSLSEYKALHRMQSAILDTLAQ